MDYMGFGPPAFEAYPPYLLTQASSVPGQAYRSDGDQPMLEAPASETIPIARPLRSIQSYTSFSFNLPQAPPYNQSQNVQAFNSPQSTPQVPMGPPTKPRKRKAPTLRADAWEPYKARIIQLHHEEGLPLREVKDTIEREFGFKAEIRQYRTRISQWGKDKNIKSREMKAIVRKYQQRKLVEGNKGMLAFEVRDTEVKPQNIHRWMKRNEIPENALYVPSPAASTPSAVGCWTVSERGSPAPSLTSSVSSPAFQAGFMSAVQSPQAPSPAPSISSILRHSTGIFTGESPAPINFADESEIVELYVALPTWTQTPQQPKDSIQSRYRQVDEERLRQELSELEELYGIDHAETLGTLSKLCGILIDQGRYRSAEELARRLVETHQRESGNENIDTLEALDLLGEVRAEQGFYLEAEEILRRVFKSKKAILGQEHYSTLATMMLVAWTLEQQEHWKEAEELEVKVLAVRKKLFGEEDRDTLAAMIQLASTYDGQNRHEEAEELEVQALETSKRLLGEDHPAVLAYMNNLAVTYRKQKRWKEAEELNVKKLALSKRVLGEEHPATIVSMGQLGFAYSEQERWEEAEELTAKVLASRTRVLGEEHPETLMSMHNLAVSWKLLGRIDEAISLMERCVELRKQRLGPEHRRTVLSLEFLDEWREENGHDHWSV